MKFILSIIQFILIVYISFDEFHKRSLSVFLWATLFLLFGLVHLFTCFMSENMFPDRVLNTASLYVILFCLIYLFFRKLLFRKDNFALTLSNNIDNDYITNSKNKRLYSKFLIILDILLTIIVLYQLYYLITFAGGIFNTSWGTMRHSINNQYLSFSQIFVTLFFAASSCLLLSLYKKNKFLIVYNFGLVLAEVLISRNRIEILPIFCSFLVFYMLKIHRLKIKQIIVVCIMAIIAVYGVYSLRTFRHYGSLSSFMNEFSASDFITRTNSYFLNDDGELGLKKYFYYFIYNDNNFDDFGKGNTYKRILFVWLPTKWSFGIKPNDFALSMGHAVDPTIKGYSVHPTLFGDCYANLGFWGSILLGMFWAIYVTVLDKIVIKQKDLFLKLSMYSLSAIAYVIIARGSVYNGFVWMFFGFIILYCIDFVLHIRINSNKNL